MSDAQTEAPQIPITELSRAQRRVLGVLVEKAITTPEAYPLTLKATTTGCNQKSNRDPIANYEEDKVEEVLDELRALGLVAIVHTDTGRTARFRHYMRKRFTLTEPQLAILTELLLRGEQSLGELRTRASRMAPIESLEQLRVEVAGLIEQKFVRANGSLERRGVLVDHALYPAQERRPMTALAPESTSSWDDSGREEPRPPHTHQTSASAYSSAAAKSSASAATADFVDRLGSVEAACQELRQENRQLQEAIHTLKEDFQRLVGDFEDLRRALGG
jgi:uncharacterized protein YceH (UPF0502 family)